MIYTFFNNDLFHFKHIIILVICLLYIIFGSIFAIRKLDKKTFYKILLGIGILSETIKVMTYIVLNESTLGGYLPKSDLPFHLCSIQILFIVMLNLSKNEKVIRLLESFMTPTCLFGGIAGLLLATSSSRNYMIITIQYFLFHSSIVIFAIYLLKKNAFTIKDYINSVIFLLAMGIIAIYINSILYYYNGLGELCNNINFMYVVNPPINGLPFLNKNHGWLVYYIHFMILAVFLMSVVYIKPIIDLFKSKKERISNLS